MPSKTELYVQPAAMEPLLPSAAAGLLAELTCEILRQAWALSAHLPSVVVRDRVARMVREMNSYYSNLIEGHKALPRDIERAMRDDYSDNPAHVAARRAPK